MIFNHTWDSLRKIENVGLEMGIGNEHQQIVFGCNCQTEVTLNNTGQ